MPQMPEKPEMPGSKPATAPRRASWWAIALAVILALFFASGAVVLTLGAFGGVLALGLGIFLFAALHYLVWGWWLSDMIHRDVAREDEEEK